MDGILLIDKPEGWTSHDVVAKVRSKLRTEFRIQNSESNTAPNSQFPIPNSGRLKVGHTGTLDPMATGLLVLVVGIATKRAQQFSKLDKTYEAGLTLGATSDTGDSEGEKHKVSSKKPSPNKVTAVLNKFKGKTSQTPPVYSAVKVGGQRAYKLARAGKKVEISPRDVNIYEIQNTKYKYPKLHFTARVSSGTYIRSLVADIGRQLGTGAYLSSLRRTSVGEFSIDQAMDLENWLKRPTQPLALDR